MNKEKRLVDEFKMREELYGNDMLDEYFYYEDDIEDLTQNLVHAVKLEKKKKKKKIKEKKESGDMYV